MEHTDKMSAVRELLEQGKKHGKLDYKEVAAVLEELDMDGDQIDKFFDSLEQLGIDVQVDYVDDSEPLDDVVELNNIE